MIYVKHVIDTYAFWCAVSFTGGFFACALVTQLVRCENCCWTDKE